jgi:hypothetical protein
MDRRGFERWLVLAAALSGCGSGAMGEPPCTSDDAGVPNELRCTGLYSDWPSRSVAPENQPYEPGHALWSDGADKSRWIQLPPGAQIDVSNLNEWTFPVGTKIWKEFRLTIGGVEQRVETRLLWKVAAGPPGEWVRTAYAWSSDGKSASRLAVGMQDVPGTDHYEIPSEHECARCHAGRLDGVLGFDAPLLAAATAQGLTWDMLQAQSLLTSSNGNELVPRASLAIPGGAVESQAIGFLHTNCGVCCHNPNTNAGQMHLRLETKADHTFGAVSDTAVYTDAINHPSYFHPQGQVGTFYRIRPTDDSRSVVYYRMGQRDALNGGSEQMPPIDSHVVPTEALANVDAWIQFMTASNGYPPPAP